MNVCRYCGLEITPEELAATNSYWGGNPFPCHKACKALGIQQEAYECQVIDSDCNDCYYFVRGEVVKPPYKYYTGRCSKFNKPTNAFPLTATLHSCFVHRKSLPPKH